MNIFSNIGITELIVILLLALLVVGPERLPELARQLGKTLRDLRTAYDNLTREIGPELMSIQETTRELRESVDSVRSIPQEAVKSALKASELDETVEELKGMTESLEEAGKTIASTRQMVSKPIDAAVRAAQDALQPTSPLDQVVEPQAGEEIEEREAKEPGEVVPPKPEPARDVLKEPLTEEQGREEPEAETPGGTTAEIDNG